MERLELPGPFGISSPELEDELLSTNDSASFPNEWAKSKSDPIRGGKRNMRGKGKSP